MARQPWRVILLAVVVMLGGVGPALGFPTYFTPNCGGCHANDSATCIGCHHHGGAGGSPGTATTSSPAVTLTLSASDAGSGVAQMRFSDDGVTFGNWVSYAAGFSWRLTSGSGIKTISVQFRDRAGNVSATYRDSINYQPPAGTRHWPAYR